MFSGNQSYYSDNGQQAALAPRAGCLVEIKVSQQFERVPRTCSADASVLRTLQGCIRGRGLRSSSNPPVRQNTH